MMMNRSLFVLLLFLCVLALIYNNLPINFIQLLNKPSIRILFYLNATIFTSTTRSSTTTSTTTIAAAAANVVTKYIQYECNQPSRVCGGWADRLKGIMSTYALSIILNRSFLIQMTQPCYIDSLLVPNRVDWNLLKATADRSKLIKKVYSINDNSLLRSLFHTINLANYSREMHVADLITIQSNVMFTDCAITNVNFFDWFKKMNYSEPKYFKVRHNFYKWYKELFKLNARIEKRHQRLLRLVKPTNNTFLICLQIRIGGGTSKNVPDLSFGDKSVDLPSKFWKFVGENFVGNMSNFTTIADNYRIFVTTDTERLKVETAKRFGEDRVVYNEYPTAHMDIDYENLRENCGHIDNVILDFHMMQYCDASVISHSGFGLLGSWNRPEPARHLYVLTKPNQNDLKNVYWDRSGPLEFKKINNLDEDLYFL